MNILGVSAYSHDGAVCLMQDGEIVAAASEEQFVRKSNVSSNQDQSIASCLQQAGIDAGDLDLIAFDTRPFLKLERTLKTYLAFAPAGMGSFLREMPLWFKHRLRIKTHIVQETGFQGKVIFPEHHEALAASAFFPSPFQEAAFLVVDGVGEWATASYGLGDEEGITVLAEMRFPHSLGFLYSAFSHYLGFKVNSGEDTMMDPSFTGEPKYKKKILSRLMDLKEDGSFRLDMDYFEYQAGLLVANERFAELFGRPTATAGGPSTAMDMDLACSIRAVIEEIVLKMVEHLHVRTGRKKLCLSGWVSRNCVDRDRILRESSFDDIWVQPEAGGAGAALGAAMFAWHQYLGNKKFVESVPG